MISMRPILIFVLVTTLCSLASAQSSFDDSSLRRDVASRIARDHGVMIAWQQTSLMQLMDAEARLNTTKRIRDEYGVTFDWQKTTLMVLMDAEARMGTARRTSQATNKPVDWKQYTLMQLMEMETKLAGGNVDAIKKQATSRTPRGGKTTASGTTRGLGVYVIAPSVSTSMEARSIRMKKGWSESSLRQADAILVVVRSMLFNPLNYSYGSVKELEADADNQLNIAGENFHVYIYSIDDNIAVTQEKHISYKADS
jgi:hypothetical protein